MSVKGWECPKCGTVTSKLDPPKQELADLDLTELEDLIGSSLMTYTAARNQYLSRGGRTPPEIVALSDNPADALRAFTAQELEVWGFSVVLNPPGLLWPPERTTAAVDLGDRGRVVMEFWFE